MPETLRLQLDELGLCRDEFARYGHSSPQLYVRESIALCIGGHACSSFYEMADRNKVSYDYFTTKPAAIFGKEFEYWKTQVEKRSK